MWPAPRSWSPRDESELTAGWRLWLELRDRVWPDTTWTGTPADAVRRLRELQTACDGIEQDHRRESPGGEAALSGLVRSLVFAMSPAIELWADDDAPLDAERAALLHADLANFAALAEHILTALAEGGGWSTLNDTRQR